MIQIKHLIKNTNLVPKQLSENAFFRGFKPLTEFTIDKNINSSNEDEYRLKIFYTFLSNLNSFFKNILENKEESDNDSSFKSFVSLFFQKYLYF